MKPSGNAWAWGEDTCRHTRRPLHDGAEGPAVPFLSVSSGLSQATTHYYICIDNQEAIFDVNMTDESLIDVIRYKEGDTIKLSYTEGDNINQVNEILKQ